MSYIEVIWKELKKNWKTLAICGISFIIVFFPIYTYVCNSVWIKWNALFLFCPLVSLITVLYNNKGKDYYIKIDYFYVIVLCYSSTLLIKSTIENTPTQYTWYVASFIVMYSFFYLNTISKPILFKSFAYIGLLLSIIGIVQYSNKYNFIVGPFDNPAGYSLTLTLFIPFVFCHFKYSQKEQNNKWIYLSISIIMLIAILLSQSRTAIIANFFILIPFITKKLKWLTYSLFMVILAILIFVLKNDSTIGRLFILKNSTHLMNTDSLIWGYGFGGFKKYYMPLQADYFKTHVNDKYSLLADNILHPLNEFVLFFTEQGGLLFIFLMTIIIIVIRKMPKRTPQYSCIIGILIFSCFSYPFRYPLTIIMLAYSLSYVKINKAFVFKHNLILNITICIFSILWIGSVIFNIKNVYVWNELHNKVKLGQFYKVKDKYKEIFPLLKDNESFLFNYASILWQNGYFNDSYNYTKQCAKLINNYDTQLLLGDNCYKLHKYKQALYHYNTASQMCPNRFIPLYGIFNIYKTIGNKQQMISNGYKILNKPIKIKSKTIYEIQADVQQSIHASK